MTTRKGPLKFGARVSAIRKALGLTRERFAQLLGVSLATINRWELEDVVPSNPTFALVEALEAAVKRNRGAEIRDQFLAGAFGAAGGPRLYHFIYRSAYE